MSEKYLAVVLSDLHLGEEDSVLMRFGEGGELSFEDEIAAGVKKLIRKVTGQKNTEYLILAGDILELSLATRVEAFKSVKKFIDEFNDLFKKTLIYIPGNHDHHMWVALQEEARILSQIRDGNDVRPYYHAFIPTIHPDGIELPQEREISRPYGSKTFLYDLLPQDAKDKKKDFLVAYPNVYLNLGQKVLVTHGHFFEDAWTLFSDAIPNSLKLSRLSYKLIEQINSPFVEFGWYHLGQAGKLAVLLEELWDEVNAGRHEKMDKVVDEIGHYLDIRLDFRPKNEKSFRAFLHDIIGRPLQEFGSDRLIELSMMILKRLVISQISAEEPKTPGSTYRHAADILTDERKREKIESYLAIAMYDDEFKPDSLVFGHTHVPFLYSPEEQNVVDVGNKSVKAYNTGGWVADVLEPEHLRSSRPMIFGIKEDGIVDMIDVGWPSKSEFEEIIYRFREEMTIKKEIKRLIKDKLIS